MATINASSNQALRNAIQNAESIDIINIITNNLSGVTTLGKISSYVLAPKPQSGYTVTGSTGSPATRTLNNTRIYQENVDGHYSPGLVKDLTLRYTTGGFADGNSILSATTGNFTLQNLILTGSHRGWDGNSNKYISLTSFNPTAPITVPLTLDSVNVVIQGQGNFNQATGIGGSAFLHSWNNNGPVTITNSSFDESGFSTSLNLLGTGTTPSGTYTISNNTFLGGFTVRPEGNRLQNVNATLTDNLFTSGSYLDLYGDISGVTLGSATSTNSFETISDLATNAVGYGIRITDPNFPAFSKNLLGTTTFTGSGLPLKYVNEAANASYKLIGAVTVEATPLNSVIPTPSSFSNLIAGGQANDAITGTANEDWMSGDSGNDTLTGGGGADAFVFATPLNGSTNVDTITDFSVGNDQIWLSSVFFPGVTNAGSILQTVNGSDLELRYPNPGGTLFAVLQGVTSSLTDASFKVF
jgi:Ca2+-binding RTX toxin-like protein